MRRRPGGITGRTIVLSALVIGVVLLLILPVSNYLHQRSQIEQLQQQIADRKQQISNLTDKNQLLDDPTYIKAQARERLNYVLPGDKVYVVSNEGPGSTKDAQKKKAAKKKQKEEGSGLTDLAKSIEEADKGK